MAKTKPTKRPVSARVPITLIEAIDAIGREELRSRAYYIEQGIELILKKKTRELKKFRGTMNGATIEFDERKRFASPLR